MKVRPLVVGVKVWPCDCSPAGYILSLVLLTLPRQHLVKLYLYVLTALLLFAGHQVSRYAVSSPLHLQCFHLTLTAGETASIFLSFTFLLLSTQKNKVFIILVFNSWFSEISVETASSLGSGLDSSVPCDKNMMKWLVRTKRQILTVLRWTWEFIKGSKVQIQPKSSSLNLRPQLSLNWLDVKLFRRNRDCCCCCCRQGLRPQWTGVWPRGPGLPGASVHEQVHYCSHRYGHLSFNVTLMILSPLLCSVSLLLFYTV